MMKIEKQHWIYLTATWLCTISLILNKEINLKGIQTPINKEIYEPVLKELENYGIFFNEK